MASSKTETRLDVRKMMPWKYSRVRRKTGEWLVNKPSGCNGMQKNVKKGKWEDRYAIGGLTCYESVTVSGITALTGSCLKEDVRLIDKNDGFPCRGVALEPKHIVF